MRRRYIKISVAIAGLTIVGAVALPGNEAHARKGFRGGSTTYVVPRVSPSTRSTQPAATAAVVATTADQTAAQDAAMERAKRKLDAERGATPAPVQVNHVTDAPGTLTCIAGCYK